MNKIQGLFWSAGILSLVGAIGHMLTSIPAIYGHFSHAEEVYWANRLSASLILGSIAQYLTAGMIILGAYLFTQKDAGKRYAGKLVLLLGAIPHGVNIVTLLILTPSDWSHAIIHTLALTLILIGMLL